MSACVQKLGVGTSPALDRATTYYRIISENEIVIGLEDGNAELNEGESQTVSVIVLGFEA